MSTEYPTALDSWPVIEANTQENAVDKYHDVVHVNVHDALAAVQAKLGIDDSADDTSIDNRLAVVETSADLNASDIEDINTALTGAYFVPSGGTTAQILAKASDTDGDTEWIDAPSGGSGGGSSPTTTKGDLIVRGMSADGRLPVGTDGQIPYADSGETLGIRWGDAPSGGSGSGLGLSNLLHVADIKSSGTAGGASSSGSNTRVLNTEVVNNISGASLASNQITLPAGTYRIDASAPTYQSQRTRVSLYNVTDSAVAILGISSYASPVDHGSVRAQLSGYITIAAEKVFELRHYINTSESTYGLGVNVSDGNDEIYAVMMIWKL